MGNENLAEETEFGAPRLIVGEGWGDGPQCPKLRLSDLLYSLKVQSRNF